MNYRDYKIFFKDGVYHIFNRGVARQGTFLDDRDYELFLRRLKEQVLGEPIPVQAKTSYRRKVFQPGMFAVLAYCLMPNHFHIVVKQLTDVPVSELFLRVLTGYGKVFNLKYERVGPVFQDRFKAVAVMTDEQLLWLSAYIHQNPKVAGLVRDLTDWPWSSYLDYIGKRSGRLVDQSIVMSLPNIQNNTLYYNKFVEGSYESIWSRKEIENLTLD
jgi:putative transposase